MTGHHEPPVPNQDGTALGDEQDPTTRLDTEPTGPETDPLAGVDPAKRPAPRDQPWRRIAKEVKQSVGNGPVP